MCPTGKKQELLEPQEPHKRRKGKRRLLSPGSTGFQSPFPYPVEPVSDNRVFFPFLLCGAWLSSPGCILLGTTRFLPYSCVVPRKWMATVQGEEKAVSWAHLLSLAGAQLRTACQANLRLIHFLLRNLLFPFPLGGDFIKKRKCDGRRHVIFSWHWNWSESRL